MAKKIRMNDFKYRGAFQPLNKQRGYWATFNSEKREKEAVITVLKKK